MWYVDLELWCMYLLLAGGIAVAVWATVRSLRHQRHEAAHHHVPARRIAIGTTILTLACVVVTFLAGSTKPLQSNGTLFADATWLRLTDMFINTALVLMLVAALCVACNRWMSRRNNY